MKKHSKRGVTKPACACNAPHSDMRVYNCTITICNQCGKSAQKQQIICECNLPFDITSLDNTWTYNCGFSKLHKGRFHIDVKWDTPKDFCPCDSSTYLICEECACITDNTLCSICSVKYQCSKCNGSTWGQPQEHINAKICTSCTTFHNCIDCKRRYHSRGKFIRCLKCSTRAIICVTCEREIPYRTVALPGRTDKPFCLCCTPLNRVYNTATSYMWLLQKGRAAPLLDRVRRLITECPTELSFDDATRLYLIVQWQNEVVGKSLPDLERTANACVYKSILYEYLGNAAAARIKLREGFVCPYIYIFFLRWLPQDIIMKIYDILEGVDNGMFIMNSRYVADLWKNLTVPATIIDKYRYMIGDTRPRLTLPNGYAGGAAEPA